MNGSGARSTPRTSEPAPEGGREGRDPDAGEPGTNPRHWPETALPVDHLLAGYLAVTGAVALASFTGMGLAVAALHAALVWMLTGPVARLGVPGEGDVPPGDADGGGAGPALHLLRFARVAYPVLLTPLLYSELDLLNQLHVQGYLDPTVQAWEEALFGAQLSVVWAEAQPWRWLSELMHLGYFSYYLLIPISAVLVYRRAGPPELHRFTLITGLGFFVCYVIFTLFPVAGPRYLYEQLAGTPARALFFEAVHAIAEQGSSKGTAFPSSHVSGTVAAWLATRRVAPTWFRVAAAFVLLLTLGTVYGRFHYAVDALAGLAVGAAAWRLGPLLEGRLWRGERGGG